MLAALGQAADGATAPGVLNAVKEWETTSVEFKEVVGLRSPTEKGEFVKDVLALATTGVSLSMG